MSTCSRISNNSGSSDYTSSEGMEAYSGRSGSSENRGAVGQCEKLVIAVGAVRQ